MCAGPPCENFGWRDREKTRRQTYCRPSFAQYHREWYERHREAQKSRSNRHRAEVRRRHREIVQSAKATPCADCGGVFPAYIMDFDHVRGDKLGIVSALVYSASTESLLAEIAKCDVVCSNCHRERTHQRLQPSDPGA